jgi:hypothetical protein
MSYFRRFEKLYYRHPQGEFHNTLYGEEYWHAMKKYKDVELQLHLFSTSALDQMSPAPAALSPVHVEEELYILEREKSVTPVRNRTTIPRSTIP